MNVALLPCGGTWSSSERKRVKSTGVRVCLCLCVCGSALGVGGPWMGEGWGQPSPSSNGKNGALRAAYAGLKGIQHVLAETALCVRGYSSVQKKQKVLPLWSLHPGSRRQRSAAGRQALCK